MNEKQIIYKQEPLLALKIGIGVWLGFFLIILTIVAVCYFKPPCRLVRQEAKFKESVQLS